MKKRRLDDFPLRYALLASALAVAGAVGVFLGSAGTGRAAAGSVFGLPFVIGEWRGREVVFRDEVRGILETDSVLMREYRGKGRRVRLAVVYYPDARVALHLPESCYTGQGSNIVGRSRERVNGFLANLLDLEGSKGNQLVLYYFETGNLKTASYGRMRLALFMGRLRGKQQGCALVRLSLRKGDDPGQDLAVLKEFAGELSGVLARYLP